MHTLLFAVHYGQTDTHTHTHTQCGPGSRQLMVREGGGREETGGGGGGGYNRTVAGQIRSALEIGIQFLLLPRVLPACSWPQFFPIEHLWDSLGRMLHQHQPPKAPKPTAADRRPAACLERDPHGCYNPASCEVRVVVK